ncbi:MAG: YceI family protein [Anaerolineae bacterium]|nr:YceI family protein [Anaerolineae bacterium]
MSWQLDKAHSSINFSVRHMMISTVRGRFEEFDGTFDLNEANPNQSKIEVVIQTASINTKDAQRDAHLKSPDFFDIEQYPVITFKSKRVEQLDKQHARLVGNLTIKDVTKEVVLDVEYAGQAKSPWGTINAGFTAQTKINRKDWGLTWNVALETGGVLVSDEVTISIELEIIKQAEAAPALEPVLA